LIDQNTYLNWVTASEINNQGFEIQRTDDNGTWKSIGFVKGRGESEVEARYQFVDDETTLGSNYYRLKQLDYDGNFEYSNIVEVWLEGFEGDIRLYPNPVHNQLIIANGIGTAKVYNSFGDLVAEFPLKLISRILTQVNYLLEYTR